MIALTGLATACHRNDDDTNSGKSMQPAAESAFARTERLWRETRRATLLKPDGWTSLVGLHWLDPGAHYIGSAADNGIRLAMGPSHLGMVTVDAKGVRFVPDQSAALTLDDKPLTGEVTLRTDVETGGASVIGFDEGKGAATVVERSGRHALRVRHADAPTRLQFAGLDYWPADPSWLVKAKFVPHESGRTMEVANIIGSMDAMSNPGTVEFEHDGKAWKLEALDEGEGVLFLVFADRTNGHGSYGAGRFLDAPMPDAQGNVLLDFNQSRNPPCAFTSFATCPLPPPENRLDLAITAGEKAYAKPGNH
ncbi:DUF1684 domain-containing protein [Cognatiluteimonas profundi]|uniref:DUF1684 domain-containing protein n=1 Tax=Cognatiluteimonas profundi TaxID=2594501 RepID=UPI0018EF1F7D|nr:DUF1684 domain-containing protein [Lysobacter profundi]